MESDVGTALVAGLVAGLLPLIGFVRDRRRLAIVGFVVTAVSGLILGLILAVPVAIGFTLAIFLWKPAQDRRTTPA
jgi:hypothetical protein